jgi:hypothetical protein
MKAENKKRENPCFQTKGRRNPLGNLESQKMEHGTDFAPKYSILFREKKGGASSSIRQTSDKQNSNQRSHVEICTEEGHTLRIIAANHSSANGKAIQKPSIPPRSRIAWKKAHSPQSIAAIGVFG